MSQAMQTVQEKRNLTKTEIKDILSFLQPSKTLPPVIANASYKRVYNQLKNQLKTVEIYPEQIYLLSIELERQYHKSKMTPGESVGVICGQSIGEKQTQSTLNVFHKAGSSDRQPVTSKFSELLNATKEPKVPSFMIYFNNGNNTIAELRDTMGYQFVHLTIERLMNTVSYFIDKDEEMWYKSFAIMSGMEDDFFVGKSGITIKFNMDLLYEYQIQLGQIAELLLTEFGDIENVIYSPDCFGQIDIFLDTGNIELEIVESDDKSIESNPETDEKNERNEKTEKKEKVKKGKKKDQLLYITKDNCVEIYLEDVAIPAIKEITIAGIHGINNRFFLQDKNKKWIVETENQRVKPHISVSRFKKLLAHPNVDITQTVSNNIWDIYYTFGIGAVREFMIEQFSSIVGGVDRRHIMLLVDKMVHEGTISSISRYTMKKEESGPLSKATFEETLDNLLNGGIFGQEDSTKGVSASIICGKRGNFGTGLCDLRVNTDFLNTIDEE